MSSPQGDDHEDEGLDPNIFSENGAMNPNHPLLQRAQNVLKQQLLDAKQKLQEELREKTNAVRAVKQKREDAGVELYGFQQNLAKLQLQLEKAHEDHQTIMRIRAQAEEDLQRMREFFEQEATSAKQERSNHEAFQRELDQQAAALKQIEKYNEEMKSQIAATRRAAYVAEGAVQKLEKEKMEQDYLIDSQQDTLKQLHQQLALYTAQLEAQKRETRAAQETLAEADAEMESVHFEKKQLVAQWRSTVNAVMKREEALQAVQEAMQQQQEQEIAIDNEIQGYKKDIMREQATNEQLTAVLRKVEGEVEWIRRQGEAAAEKAEQLQEVASKLQKSLEQTEEALKRSNMEAKALSGERDSVEKAMVKVVADIRTLEESMLEALGEQTAAERSAQKTAQDTRELRRRIRDEELQLTEAQNEMAKLQVDILNTEAHNERLAEALALLEEEVGDKENLVGRYQQDLKRRMEDIDKKTREVDLLNKKYEKMVASGQDVETGPLEAIVNNLQKEITTKGQESKELQRHWISTQTNLVNLQHENNRMTETVARMKAEQTVARQKQQRLEQQLAAYEKETKSLTQAMATLQVDLQRVNALIAQNTQLKSALAEDNFNLEAKIMADLKDMEEQAAHLQSQIEMYKQQKRATLAEIVEVERQIMLWERKIQLEREMQDMLDPTVGTDVVGAMKKEIHRMELRHTELMRVQEKLMQDMEKAISKRELIGLKGKAATTKKSQELTRQQQERATTDLQRSIKDTERECQITEARLRELERQQSELTAQMEGCSAHCSELRQLEEQVKLDITEAGQRRYRLLLFTTRHQRIAKRHEDIECGKYKTQVQQEELLQAELQKARDKQACILSVVAGLKNDYPALILDLDRLLCHVAG